MILFYITYCFMVLYRCHFMIYLLCSVLNSGHRKHVGCCAIFWFCYLHIARCFLDAMVRYGRLRSWRKKCKKILIDGKIDLSMVRYGRLRSWRKKCKKILVSVTTIPCMHCRFINVLEPKHSWIARCLRGCRIDAIYILLE